jgi:hypothetical protein
MFNPRPGEHWTIIGPTGCGKTWLAWQILKHTTSPDHPGLVLLKKPRDPVTMHRARELDYRVERTWPPPSWAGRPPGYVLHPKSSFDEEIDRPHKRDQFRAAMLDAYRRNPRRWPRGVALYLDDGFGASEILGLRQTMIELWTEARTSPLAFGTGFQKPTHVPTWAYSQAEHLWLFHDPDRRNRERFAEIGGIDPDVVKSEVMGLPEFHALYICRKGPTACVITA